VAGEFSTSPTVIDSPKLTETMTSLAYTDEQQIDELVSQIIEDFENLDDNESEEILGELDSLIAQILQDS
jgi:hypothetical protein